MKKRLFKILFILKYNITIYLHELINVAKILINLIDQ